MKDVTSTLNSEFTKFTIAILCYQYLLHVHTIVSFVDFGLTVLKSLNINMSMEDFDMHDMTEERQEEEEEETNFDWNGYDNSLGDFSDNASQYDGNLPSTSYDRPELDKNIALERFRLENLDDNFELDPHDDNILDLRNRTSASPSGGILLKPIGERGDYLKPQIALKREGGQLK